MEHEATYLLSKYGCDVERFPIFEDIFMKCFIQCLKIVETFNIDGQHLAKNQNWKTTFQFGKHKILHWVIDLFLSWKHIKKGKAQECKD